MAHIDIELTLLPVQQKKENTTFILRILKLRFRFVHRLIPVLLLGSLGIGKRCFGSRNNSTISNPFAYGFLISREISKVSFELPEGFSVTAEKWQQQGMFRVTQNISGYSRKPCRRVASPKSGNLFKPAVFLVYSLYFIPYSFILLYSVVRPMPSNAAAIVRLPFVCSSA